MGAIVQLKKDLNAYVAPDAELRPFRAWHVEALLTQAGELLDRAAATRTGLRALEERRTEWLYRARILESELENENARIQSNYYLQENGGLSGALPHFLNASIALDSARLTLQAMHAKPEFLADLSIAADMKRAEAAFEFEAANRRLRGAAEAMLPAEAPRRVSYAKERYAAGLNWLRSIFVNREKAFDERRLIIDDQIDAAFQSCKDDFADAYKRCLVAQKGLAGLYGYKRPVPATPAAAPIEFDLLDSCLLWLRAAIRWLSATLQYEQVFSSLYALKSLIGEDGFKALRDELSAQNESSFEFRIPGDREAAFSHVRFRGLSVTAIGHIGRPLNADLIFPTRAYSQQYKDDTLEKVVIKQDDLPICRIGRIESTDAWRAPDVVGANSLINVSPFGHGTGQNANFRLLVRSEPGQSLAQLEDLMFEFVLAGLPT